MARRWLLGILGGVAMTLGTSVGAMAQELPPTEVSTASTTSTAADPIVVPVADVATVTVTPDEETPSLRVDAEVAEVAVEDTSASASVSAELSPSGPAVDAEAPVTVGGETVPTDEVVEPVEEAVGRPSESPSAPAGDPTTAPAAPAAGAPAPAPAPTTTERTETAGPAVPSAPTAPTAPTAEGRLSPTERALLSAGRSGGGPGTATVDVADGELSPEVAPAADPTATTLAVPPLEDGPSVPALLRLLAAAMVVGTAGTWQRVQARLA